MSTRDDTVVDPMPFGARQRVKPRSTFKAVASKITRLPAIPAPAATDEAVIDTERVPRLSPPPVAAPSPRRAIPPPLPAIRRMNVTLTARPPQYPPPVLPVLRTTGLARILERVALPVGGLAVLVLLVVYLALPGH